MTQLLRLSHREATDPAVAGGKAARLARAAVAGLPVRPGVVVPADASRAALAEAMAAGGGVPGARLAVMATDVDGLPGLAELPAAAARLGAALVVRSSSPLEGDTRWSGAFTSLLDVRPGEVHTAVRAVWASALDADALARLGPAGGEAPPVAVLVQGEVRPDFSGTAQLTDTGDVTVVTVAGSPAPLLTGWEPGVTARVEPDGAVRGDTAVALAGASVLRRATDLVRAVRAELGDELVEWAAVDGEVVLLQCKTATRPVAAAAPYAPRHLPDGAAEIAHRVLRYAGPAGEQLVLPWLLAGRVAVTEPAEPAGPAPEPGAAWHAWEEATRLAAGLAAETWPGAADPGREAAETLAALRGRHPAEAVERLGALPPPDPARASRALALFTAAARHLVVSGALRQVRHAWALSPDEVRRLLAGRGRPDPAGAADAARRAALRWEPLVYTTVTGYGEHAAGRPVSPGSAAGPVVFVPGRPERTDLPPRAVIVAPRPLPHLAPLLWGASALVTFGGSGAAHLVEVARSLTVPAVVGCAAEHLLAAPDAGTLAAVDGDRGAVAVANRSS